MFGKRFFHGETPRLIVSKTCRDFDILAASTNDRIVDSRHFKLCLRKPSVHKFPRRGYDRQIAVQCRQCGIVSKPGGVIKKGIGELAHGQMVVQIQSRRDHAIVICIRNGATECQSDWFYKPVLDFFIQGCDEGKLCTG